MSFRDWYVGMRVVCIDRPGKNEPPPNPVYGKVYTLQRIWTVRDRKMVLIDLVECPAKRIAGYHTGYRADAFRPVQTRKTDISIFTALLDKPRVPA